jgi:hypothetical protein
VFVKFSENFQVIASIPGERVPVSIGAGEPHMPDQVQEIINMDEDEKTIPSSLMWLGGLSRLQMQVSLLLSFQTYLFL